MAKLGNVLFAFAVIAMGGLLFGYMIGVNSNIITPGQLICDVGSSVAGTWSSWGYGQCYDLSSLTLGLLSSLNLIGACVASLVCFRYSDALGRKLEVQLAAVLYMGGALMVAGSPFLWGVFLGLLIYGFGIGFAMHAAPVYIAEISPADIRGTLVSAKEAVIVFGIFLGFLAGFAFSSVGPHGWRYMIVCPCVFASIMLVGMARVPESPRFLVLKEILNGGSGKPEDIHDDDMASAALQFFRQASAQEVRDELLTLYAETAASVGGGEARRLISPPGASKGESFWPDAFSYTKPLVVGCGLVFLQQVTGQPSVLYYATNIFKAAGFGASSTAQSVLLGLVKLVATMFTVWNVDSYGRRPLLFIGISMMALALFLTTAGFYHAYCSVPDVSYADCSSANVALPKEWALVTVAALMLYVSGYQVGFGPISWLLISEIFPLKVRGSAFSVAAVVNFASNIAVTLGTAPLMEAFSPTGLFFIFFCMSFVSLAFVALLVPETKGKTLEEIEQIMRP